MMHIIKKILSAINPKLEEGEFYRDTFQKELNYQSGRVMTLACVSTFGWLGYIPIDHALFPGEPIIILLRICFPLMGITLFVLCRLPFFQTRNLLLLTYFGAHMAISCAILTGMTGGHPAYVGGFLFVLTLLALGPVHRQHALMILYGSVIVFFIVGISKGMKFSDPVSRYSFNDIIAVTAITSVFIFILDNIRFSGWQKSTEIEMNRRIIEEQNMLLDHQISLAGELQKRLLPLKLPNVKCASIAFTYHPMMKVGGDFIDVCYCEEKKELGLFICDVSGHGVAAAFISSMVKMALADWNNHLDRPSEMLKKLYHSLVEKLGAHFVTVSMCYVDLRSGMVRFSGAGHPPSLVIRSDGKIEVFKPAGKIINALMKPDFGTEETSLNKNDKIVLYTDGITESFNKKKEMFGDEAFFNLIKKHHADAPAVICEKIMEQIKKFTGNGSFRDDITLLVMEFDG